MWGCLLFELLSHQMGDCNISSEQFESLEVHQMEDIRYSKKVRKTDIFFISDARCFQSFEIRGVDLLVTTEPSSRRFFRFHRDYKDAIRGLAAKRYGHGVTGIGKGFCALPRAWNPADNGRSPKERKSAKDNRGCATIQTKDNILSPLILREVSLFWSCHMCFEHGEGIQPCALICTS